MGVDGGVWGIILGGWGRVGVGETLFWVGGGGLVWVHCLIMPIWKGKNFNNFVESKISKFHESLDKKYWNYQSLNATPYVEKLALV